MPATCQAEKTSAAPAWATMTRQRGRESTRKRRSKRMMSGTHANMTMTLLISQSMGFQGAKLTRPLKSTIWLMPRYTPSNSPRRPYTTQPERPMRIVGLSSEREDISVDVLGHREPGAKPLRRGHRLCALRRCRLARRVVETEQRPQQRHAADCFVA